MKMTKIIKALFVLACIITIFAFFSSCSSFKIGEAQLTMRSAEAASGVSANIMKSYFNRLETVEDKVYAAIAIIKCMYPDWHDNYKESEFDCSEMSAYVKQCFTAWGIPVTLVQSNKLWHVWLEIPNKYGERMLIEATSLRIVPRDEWDEYYHKYDVNYNRKLRSSEVDWWNSKYLKSKYSYLKAKNRFNEEGLLIEQISESSETEVLLNE